MRPHPMLRRPHAPLSPRVRHRLGLALLCALALLFIADGLLLGPRVFASPTLNNEGVSPFDGQSSSANFDGGGYAYSNALLTSHGYASGALITAYGERFLWPTVTNGARDNWQASGQTLPLSSSVGNTLGFLGAASDGDASGAATVHYTDGTTKTFTLAFSDWTLDGGAEQPLSGEHTAVTMSYRERASGGGQTIKTYVFYVAVSLTAGKTAASVTLPSSVSGGQLHVFAVSGAPSPGPSNWTTYLGGPDHTGFNGAESTLHAGDISHLTLKWDETVSGAISIQPIEANGVVYWGAWNGSLYATNLNGVKQWSANLGQTNDPDCEPATVGVAGTPTLGAIGATAVIFASGGNGRFYALNAATGRVIWSTSLGSPPDVFLWSSPVIYNGSVYVGVS